MFVFSVRMTLYQYIHTKKVPFTSFFHVHNESIGVLLSFILGLENRKTIPPQSPLSSGSEPCGDIVFETVVSKVNNEV